MGNSPSTVYHTDNGERVQRLSTSKIHKKLVSMYREESSNKKKRCCVEGCNRKIYTVQFVKRQNDPNGVNLTPGSGTTTGIWLCPLCKTCAARPDELPLKRGSSLVRFVGQK